jgi:amidase
MRFRCGVKEAGAIVLAKSNMAEWAFTPYETVSSILPGYTKNPTRSTA